MVRPADNGLSIAVDPYGRVLAEMDHFIADERVMVAQVPTQGVPTLYAVVGDLFDWLTVAGLAIVFVAAVVRGRSEHS